MKRILFICSSNVCRSPYCEMMMRKLISEDELLSGKIEVDSSAVFNKSKEIFPKAVDVLLREGIDNEEIMSHKPTFKWGAMEKFREADVIVGMSKTHKLLTPIKYKKKCVTLSQIATGKYELIPDPFLALSQQDYDRVMGILKRYLYQYMDVLRVEFGGEPKYMSEYELKEVEEIEEDDFDI